MSDQEIEGKVTEIRDVPLPPYYSENFSSLMKRAAYKDKEFSHKWVKKSRENQMIKIWKGWTPLTDKDKIEFLGLGLLINERGRAEHIDTELWVMPKEVAAKIRQFNDRKTAEKSESLRIALEVQAEEAKGYSKGKAIPYIRTTQITQDVYERGSGGASLGFPAKADKGKKE